MDPDLEHRHSWRNFQRRRMTAIAINLASQQRPQHAAVVAATIDQTDCQDPDGDMPGVAV
jgi:RNase P protein component